MNSLMYLKEGEDYMVQFESIINRLFEIKYSLEQNLFASLELMKETSSFEQIERYLDSWPEIIHFILKCSKKLDIELSEKLKKIIEDYEKFVVNGMKKKFIERIQSGVYD